VIEGDRGTAIVGEGGAIASGERGTIATGERGTVAAGERGAIATGERGTVAAGERGAIAAGEGGAVAVGEEGYIVAGEGGAYAGEWYDGTVWYDDDWDDWYVYDDWDEWWLMAGVTTGIVIGTLLAEPPPDHTIIYVSGVPYYYYDSVFYAPVMQGTTVVYQVIPPPVGAIAPALPADCTTQSVNGVTHWICADAAYIEVPTGYEVVVMP
jgi:hypothetical protein